MNNCITSYIQIGSRSPGAKAHVLSVAHSWIRVDCVDAIYRAQHICFFLCCCLCLFHRGESLQQFFSLGEQSFLLFVCQILRVPWVQWEVGDPRRAEGPHGAWKEGPDDWGWCSDGRGIIVSSVSCFCGDLRKRSDGEVWRHG